MSVYVTFSNASRNTTFLRPRRALALVVLLLSALFLVSSRTSRAQDSDTAAVEHYTLTMDGASRFLKVVQNLGAYSKAHPGEKAALKQAIETDADKHESLAQITQRMNANPVVAGAITRAGWSTRDFVLFESALLQAEFAAALKPAEETDAHYAAGLHLNPANLAFVRDHQADLKKLQEDAASEE